MKQEPVVVCKTVNTWRHCKGTNSRLVVRFWQQLASVMLLWRGRVAPSNIDERLQASKNVPGVSWINIDRRSDDPPTLAPDGPRCLCVGLITQPVCLRKYHSEDCEDEITRLLLNSTVRLNNSFAFRLGKPEPGWWSCKLGGFSNLTHPVNCITSC